MTPLAPLTLPVVLQALATAGVGLEAAPLSASACSVLPVLLQALVVTAAATEEASVVLLGVEPLQAATPLSPGSSSRLLGFHPMREFASLTAGYAACESEHLAFPFVVRGCLDFGASAPEASLRSLLRLEKEVKGYRESDGTFAYMTGRDALTAWLAEALDMNVIDATVERGNSLRPAAMQAVPGVEDVNPRLLLAYVLSPMTTPIPGTCGSLHVDPPLGGGWQWLCVGQKTWFCIDDTAHAFSRAACRAHANPPDMAAVAVTARVLTATISAGDFLSFPKDWPHAVITHQKSLGLSGYMCSPTPWPDATVPKTQ